MSSTSTRPTALTPAERTRAVRRVCALYRQTTPAQRAAGLGWVRDRMGGSRRHCGRGRCCTMRRGDRGTQPALSVVNECRMGRGSLAGCARRPAVPGRAHDRDA